MYRPQGRCRRRRLHNQKVDVFAESTWFWGAEFLLLHKKKAELNGQHCSWIWASTWAGRGAGLKSLRIRDGWMQHNATNVSKPTRPWSPRFLQNLFPSWMTSSAEWICASGVCRKMQQNIQNINSQELLASQHRYNQKRAMWGRDLWTKKLPYCYERYTYWWFFQKCKLQINLRALWSKNQAQPRRVNGPKVEHQEWSIRKAKKASETLNFWWMPCNLSPFVLTLVRRKTHVSFNQLYSSSPRNRDWSPANLRDNVVRPTWQTWTYIAIEALIAPVSWRIGIQINNEIQPLHRLLLYWIIFPGTKADSFDLPSLCLEIFVPCFQLTLDAGKCRRCYDFIIAIKVAIGIFVWQVDELSQKRLDLQDHSIQVQESLKHLQMLILKSSAFWLRQKVSGRP